MPDESPTSVPNPPEPAPDYLVVGRPVRNAPNPEESVARIVDDIARGLAERAAAAG